MGERRKTRNQRRQESMENILAAIVVLAFTCGLCLLLCVAACRALEHPAEQPIDGREYIEMVQMWGADHAIQNR